MSISLVSQEGELWVRNLRELRLNHTQTHQPTNVSDTIFKERVVVFDEAMGARVVVAGDINKDGRNDLVVASSTDNAIRWFENLGDQG